ncbi:MAG: hypothetical protein H6546_02955 [Chitinophagales bacterium]|nr:hypothetical protein [Chitinophagales bacterium]
MNLSISGDFLVIEPAGIDFQDVTLSSLNISILFDCCTEVYNEDVTLPTFAESMAVSYTVNEEDGKFIDGVYQVIINAEYEDGSKKKETGCIFADTSLKCSIAEVLASDPSNVLGPLYVILKNSDSCDCNCGALCEIMKRVRALLGQEAASCSNC